MNTPHSAGILQELHGSVVVLRFNRPSSRNSLSQTVLDQLENALDEVLSDERIQSVILNGADNVFASGADITELTKLTAGTAQEFSRRGQAIFQRIADAKQLTIAAINGYCMGGALDLALACDLRIASSDAVFSHPGAKLGITTGGGGTQRLPRLIGRTRALDFFITARRVDSREALEAGLISEIADPVLERALELAHEIRKGRHECRAALDG